MKNGRILLLEDRSQIPSLLAANLREQGYNVFEADGGHFAFEELKQETVDLIILDLTADVGDFQLLAEVKGDSNLQHVPVIVVSSDHDTTSVVRAIEMGAADYLTRPVDEKLLQARVKASLATKRLHDLEQETRRELHAQKALFQQLLVVAQIVSQSLSLEDTLENILRASVSLANAARGSLYLVNSNQQVTSYIYSAQKDELFTGLPTTIDRVMKSGLSGWVFQNQQPVMLKDTRADERWLAIGHEGSESRSVLAVPVSYQRDVLGVLTLVHPQPDYFKAEALGLLQAAADQMAMTLYNARLYDEQRHLLDSQRKLYKALEASESRYRDLFENANELIQGVGKDGRFQYVNKRWQEVLGYTAEEALTIPFEVIIYPDELDHCRQIFQRLQEGKTVAPVETSFITRAGEQIFVEGSLSVRLDDDGKFLSTRGIFRDVTDRNKAQKALQATLARTEALYHVSQATNYIESSSELLQTVVDSIAVSLPANRVTLLLFEQGSGQVMESVKGGVGIDDIEDINFSELLGELSGWVLREKQPALSPKGMPDPRESEEVQRRRREVNCGSVLVVPLQYRDQVWGTITAINNLEEADFTEEDVNLMVAMASQVTVAIENARLYAAEKKRVQELQAYVEELDMFAGAVAHDLKSPLTSVIGFSELLEEIIQEEKPLRFIGRIKSTGEKMDALINDLLLLSKVRQSEVPIVPVDMRKVAAEALRRLEYEIEQSRPVITWVGEPWPRSLGYAGWLVEVWINYMSNALKYGGQPLHLKLGADQPHGGQVRYWIQDNGEGLSVEDRAKLFSRFERLDQINIKGHGLGLAIVKRIVEKLGGQVGVESETGKGSLFYFILPAA